MNAVAVYLLSLAACVLAYFGYLRFAVPLIELPVEPFQRKTVAKAEMLIPSIDKSILIPLLPAGAWELEECKTLITSSGTVLFKEIEPQADGTLRLSPFTLITSVGDALLPTEDSPAEKKQKVPLALRTADGASLTLDKPIAQAIQSGAKIESARLLGEVDIYRPPSEPGEADALYVLARNVQFDRHRIYTLDTLNDPVLFSYGPHKGKGRNLRIDLLHRTDTVTGREDFSTIDGASKLELAYLDQLHIAPTTKKPDAETKKRAGVFASGDSPLEISCRGPCVFDFLQQTVSLSDQVQVSRLDQDRDNLSCSQLKVRFAKGKPSIDRHKSKLELVDLIAIGRPVVVNANSRPAKIMADRLTYDAKLDEFFGVSDPAGNQYVTLVTPQIQYKTTQLRCRFSSDENQKKTLQELDAQGPGQLLKVGENPSDELFAKWTESLSVKPSPNEPTEQILSVSGKTHVDFHEGSSIDAQRIDIKLLRLTGQNGKVSYNVKEMVASQSVHIQTPEIEGDTDRLTAEFPQSIPLKPHSVSRPTYSPAQQDIGRPAAQTPNPEDDAALNQQASRSTDGPRTKLVSDRRLKFSGRQVHVSLVPAEQDQISFNDLEIVDEVSVQQFDANQPDLPPSLNLNCDYLRVVPQASPKKYRLEMTTNSIPTDPTFKNIETADFVLAGKKINLDQMANKVWVEGYGHIKFKEPTTESPETSVRSRGGFEFANRDHRSSRNQPEENFDASWHGGMIFDGQKIYFERQVALAAKQLVGEGSTELRPDTGNRPNKPSRQQLISASCGQMSVALNRFIDFANINKKKPTRSEVHATEIIFVNQVAIGKQVFPNPIRTVGDRRENMQIFVQNLDEQGVLQQQQSISAERVTIKPATKDILADGPGWVSTHELKRNDGPRNSSSNNPLARFSPSSDSDQSKPISFVRVNFAGKLKLNGATSQMDIEDRVRSVYLSTNDWQLNVDPDRIPATARSAAVILSSQKMILARWQPREATEQQYELTAKGNVRITGEAIDLNSDRVSYNQTNDMLVVNGTTRTPAKIRYRQLPRRTSSATGWQEFSAEKFKYQVATQAISVDGVKKVTGSGSIRLN